MTPTVRPYTPGDRRWAEGLLEELMGSARAVRLGEVLSLHCRVENAGAGGALLQAAAGLAAERGCRRLWLLTTNDNLHALGFYQRRGLRLCALHAGSLERDRALKPELPEINPDNRIPMRDLLELELELPLPRAEPKAPS